MPSIDRTMEAALNDVRDEIARSTPSPEWTVLVVERATAAEIEAAARSIAAVRAVLDVLATIKDPDAITKRGERRLTLRQRSALAVYREHGPIVRAFAERYALRLTPHGVFDFETAPPWSGDLEHDRPFHVRDRLAEPEESGGLILWKVVHPGDLSDEQRAIAEAHEASRKRRVEGYRDGDDSDATADAASDAATATDATPSDAVPQPRPMTADEQRRARAREAFERLTDPATRTRGIDHAPSADKEFTEARRQRRVDVTSMSFLLNNPRHRR